MALFKSFVLGEVRKSVANITMYSGANGYSIARGKRSTMRNPKTPGQLAQRAKQNQPTGEDESVTKGFAVFCSGGRTRFPGKKGGKYVL